MKLIPTTDKVKISWFVWAGEEKLPRNATMRGSWDGFTAECSCGWIHSDRTIYSYTLDAVKSHKYTDHGYRYQAS